MPSTADVLSLFRDIKDPHTGKNIVRLSWVRDLSVTDNQISLTLLLNDPTTPFAAQVKDVCFQVLKKAYANMRIKIDQDSPMIGLGGDFQVDGHSQQSDPGDGVTNIIAVASGKGGVGKSTVASNLAVVLASQGYDVGLADVDIYGPSIPTMFGLESAKPRVNEQRRIIPIEKFGVKLLSMGFLVDPEKAVIWRGPMVSSAVKQFLGDTEWGDLDYLILDLPPGTGDIQLTIVQTVPLNGAIIVSTPQRVALADARKGIGMFEQVDVPVLGMIENMAYFTPPELPDNKYYLFGQGGARALAMERGVPFLGEIPLEEVIRVNGDNGTPVVTDPNQPVSRVFSEIAIALNDQVEKRNACRKATQKIDILKR